MMGRTSKRISRKPFLLVQTLSLADMLEAADALCQKLLRLRVTRRLLSHSHVPSTWQKKQNASVAVDASLFENDQEKALAKAIEELELTSSASDKWLSSLLLASHRCLLTIPWLWQKMRLLKTTVWPSFGSYYFKPKLLQPLISWIQISTCWQVESRCLLWHLKKLLVSMSLPKKKKTEGLTPEEEVEQAKREEYTLRVIVAQFVTTSKELKWLTR